MYVCNCNGLNERAISKAIAKGHTTAAQIYQILGCAPQCARCVPEVVAMLKAAKVEAVKQERETPSAKAAAPTASMQAQVVSVSI